MIYCFYKGQTCHAGLDHFSLRVLRYALFVFDPKANCRTSQPGPTQHNDLSAENKTKSFTRLVVNTASIKVTLDVHLGSWSLSV